LSGSAARSERALLFLIHGEPVFENQDAAVGQHAFEGRAVVEELGVLRLAAEAHRRLDHGAVVPAAIEQHELPGGRQMGHVTLEIPLCALAIIRLGQGDHAVAAGVQLIGDRLDRAALAGRVAAFEDHQQAPAALAQPALHPGQLDLQRFQLLLVGLALHRAISAG
jgi:hypothetical protein